MTSRPKPRQSTSLQILTRKAELMRLLPLWPHEVADRSPTGDQKLLSVLRRALRAERNRGLAGHWAYDLSRHAQLLALYREECRRQKDKPARIKLKTGNH
ncbi:MAG: hypothetical protein ACM3L9_06470 [Deltaproteobacteria bacterium]